MDGGQTALRTLSEVEIERVVTALRHIDRESAWERTLEVGRLVFEGVVAGNEREWRSRRGQKDVSLRKLVEHGACPYKKSTLCSAVNVHLFVRLHPGTRHLPGITPTHVVQVLGLAPEQACGLLARAGRDGWSARDLAEAVRSARKAQGERRGRPNATPSERAETMGRRVARDLRSMHAVLLDEDEGVDEAARRRLRLLLEEISELAAIMSAEILPNNRSAVILTMGKVVAASGPEPERVARSLSR